MDHATLKTTLQRRLQDTVADHFTSAILDSLLGIGMGKLQAAIHDINPGALITTGTLATAAGTDLYTKQTSSLRVIRYEILNATTGLYSKLEPTTLDRALEDSAAFQYESLRYVDLGNRVLIRPTPDAIYTVRYWHVPILRDSTSWDLYDDQIPDALHTLAVDFAMLEALGETAEDAAATLRRLEIGLGMVASLYGRSAEQVSALPVSPFSSSLS